MTVLLDADSSPVPGATVYIDTGASNSINTRVTDSAGQAFWNDTSFLTGFSADCEGQDVGTVEPYDSDTVFTWHVFSSSFGLTPVDTVINVTRQTRDLVLTVRMEP